MPDSYISAGEIAFTINRFFSFGALDKLSDNLNLAKENGYFVNQEEMNASIRRDEVCAIVCNLLEFSVDNSKQTTFLDDLEISNWSKRYVAELQSKNIIIGYPDNTFKGNNYVTKAELVTILNRCKDFRRQDLITDESGEVSKLEVGILKYDDDNIVISNIVDRLELKNGETAELSVALPDDAIDEELIIEISSPEIVSIDYDMLIIEALEEGKTSVSIGTANNEYKTVFDVIVE